ncbi:hypothetical protein PG994_011181 [Apiospora phragmitis]|uniref:Uncharacterized protein n=1 Tax=Apiospora phragmitis TaxID=2905665 RepID=A0ABR1TS54_9PEZI
MANHSSTKTSSGKKSKSKEKDPKPQSGSHHAAEAWICDQSTDGPWDAVDRVNAAQWDTPGHGSYQHPASLAATQGSSKPHKKKDHKSGGKK